MSDFGRGYVAGRNAAGWGRVSEEFWSAVTRRMRHDRVQAQIEALQTQLAAAQVENLHLRQENTELRSFSTWAVEQIGRMDEYNTNLSNMLDARDRELDALGRG